MCSEGTEGVSEHIRSIKGGFSRLASDESVRTSSIMHIRIEAAQVDR